MTDDTSTTAMHDSPPPLPPPAVAPTPGPRRISRSRNDRVIAGVCGGIGDYFGVDPVLVRMAFVALAIAGGVGVVAYLIALILVPEEPGGTPLWSRDERRAARRERRQGRSQPGGRVRRHQGQIIGLAILVVIASSVVGLRFRSDVGFALLLIAIGVALLWSRTRAAESGGDRAPGEDPVPVTETVGTAGAPPAPLPDPIHRSGGAPEPGPPRRRSDAWRIATVVGPVGVSVLLLGAGVVALLTDGLVLGAIGLGLAGLTLATGSLLGHSRAVVVAGLTLALACWAGAGLAFPWRGGIGDRTFRPAAAGDLQREYHLGIGALTVDLRDVELDGNTRVDVRVGIGELTVRVPRGTRVVVDGHAEAGAVEVFGRRADGVGVDAPRGRAGSRTGPTLRIDARIGAGHLQVLAPAAGSSGGT